MPRQASATPAVAPQAGYQLVSVVSPTAGVDLRTSPTLLPRERARTLVNFSLTNPGELVVRPGWRQFSTTSLGSTRCEGGGRIYLNTAVPTAASTIVTLVAWGGAIYQQLDNGGWSSALLSGLSSNQTYFVHDRDLVAAFNGSSALYKSTNGTSWTHLGIHSGIAPTLSTLSTGGLSSGEYELAYTYKARGLAYESNGSLPSTITLTATSGAINLVIPNSTDLQVDAWVAYARKVSAGELVLRRVSSQAIGGSSLSSLVITSTAWTLNTEVPTDHYPPPDLSFGVVWKNRWWARSQSVTNRIFFTQLFQPQSWPPLFYLDMPFERGDSIRAILPLGNVLLIFGATRVYSIIGQTSLDFEVRPALGAEEGAFGPRAVAVVEQGAVHLGANGVYLYDGANDKLLSFDIDPAWRDLVTSGTQGDLLKMAVVYHQIRRELRLAVPRRYPSGTWGEWVLDLNRTRTTGETAWTATDRAIGGYILWDGPETVSGNQGRLLTWSATAGLLNEEAVGYAANGANQQAEYEGPGLTLGASRARWIDGRFQYEPHAGLLSVEPTIDGLSAGTQPIAIGAGLALFGTAIFGTAVFGGTGRRLAYVIFPLSAEGHACTMKVTYSGQEQFKLFAYDLGIRPETTPRAFGD
jgi:hypothetical protein